MARTYLGSDSLDDAGIGADQITSGTLDDARIPGTIARDSEVTTAVAAEATMARNADNLTSGTVADARIPSTIARDTEVQGLIDAAINSLLDGAPGALNTLNELAAAVNDDATFAASVTTALAGKQPLDADLTAIAALTTTSIGRSLLAAVDDAALRTILGLGTAATTASSAYATAAQGTTADAAVPKALFDANTILAATTDNTPAALTVAASRIVGRKASGDIAAMTGAETAAVLAGEVFKQAQEVNAQTGTTYTLVAGDAGKLVTLSNASAITLTLPQDSDATIAVGTYVDLYQLGAGQVTVAAGTGATLRTSGLTAKMRAQYARGGVQKVSANTWSLFGDLAAS